MNSTRIGSSMGLAKSAVHPGEQIMATWRASYEWSQVRRTNKLEIRHHHDCVSRFCNDYHSQKMTTTTNQDRKLLSKSNMLCRTVHLFSQHKKFIIVGQFEVKGSNYFLLYEWQYCPRKQLRVIIIKLVQSTHGFGALSVVFFMVKLSVCSWEINGLFSGMEVRRVCLDHTIRMLRIRCLEMQKSTTKTQPSKNT